MLQIFHILKFMYFNSNVQKKIMLIDSFGADQSENRLKMDNSNSKNQITI